MSRNHQSVGSDSLRQRLYEAMKDPEQPLAAKRRRALELGREFLGVENGNVQRRDGDTHEVVASVGGRDLLPAGATLDRSKTYCRRTMETNSPVALSNASQQGWDDDPAYREHGLQCYLGTTIFVEGKAYGTVCFVSREARDAAFSGEEKAFVELIARLLGREIESARQDRRLEQREQALDRSERKYESLVETAPDAIVLVDTETDRVVETNAAAADLTGYDEEVLRGMSIHDLHTLDDRTAYAVELGRIVASETPRERFDDGSQMHVRRRDGSEVPVEISGDRVELDGEEFVQYIVRDVSHRVERRRELRIKNRAIDEAAVGITIADVREDDLPLVYANREFERLTGYDREGVLGRNCRFLQGPDTDAEAVDEIREALATQTSLTTELLNYRADGTPFWNELTLTPVTGADGDEVTHFVGFQRDITARKRRERLIEVLNRVLRHNLRNDMNVVEGYADLVADRTDGEVAEMASQIGETATDLLAVSEKARRLDRAVKEPMPVESRDVAADVEATVADLRTSFPDVEFRIEELEERHAAAAESLRHALHELGENAARHGESSVVEFRVEREGERGVAVHVSDSGPGLAKNERRTLEAGRETPLEHGQGLGLWLVNWLVTSMGGRVTTTVEGGTTVAVHLQASTSEATGEVATTRRQTALSTQSE